MTDLFELAVAIHRLLSDPKENWISGKVEIKGTKLRFQAYRFSPGPGLPNESFPAGQVYRIDLEY